ncbi:MAG: hypothetical protein AAF571_09780, partial [Verrucomicrobiota bacterium]
DDDDFSDSKPLPSKYEMMDSGRILPATAKRDRQQDFTFKQPQPVPRLPKRKLLAAVLISLLVGIVLGYFVAQLTS